MCCYAGLIHFGSDDGDDAPKSFTLLMFNSWVLMVTNCAPVNQMHSDNIKILEV